MPAAWVEAAKTVVWAVLVAGAIRSCVAEPFNIPSASMLPNLFVGDHLFVSKWDYGYSRHSFPASLAPFSGRMFGRQPARGDIIVFKEPVHNSDDYIKRLIGLPGDVVQMRGGRLYLNGAMLERERAGDFIWRLDDDRTVKYAQYVETLPSGLRYLILEESDEGPLDDTPEFTVPEGRYFLMGDNRDNSSDSRAGMGFVPAENLVGKARYLFFSQDGSAAMWQFWKWAGAIRWVRFFTDLNRQP
ncbi:signal peptidase I [Alphaproteobacteria bacterium]|nr:signal peptidase I [Alphaproteobacteria bacterium]